MIKPSTVNEIVTTSRIEEVVSDYVNLKRRGVNMIGLCPFHNEKTPSFTVSPSKNMYKCFGCGKGGSSVSFLMEHEKFSYPEALRYLAKKYNIQVEEEEQSDEAKERELERQSYLLINELAKNFFVSNLTENSEGRDVGLSYLKHRGLNDATIELFGLGYAPRSGSKFRQHLEDKGYSLDKAKELGLISAKDHDFFRERVIFPFHNLSGKPIGFGGRIMNDHIKAPKYVNSKESNLYNKRNTLYGLYLAKNEIRRERSCILVEGYTDVLSLWQHGIKNVVASSGTSLTSEQARLLRRFTVDVTVVYDGDQAGQSAAFRGLNILVENGLNVRIVVLPKDSDPDSTIRRIGVTDFKDLIENQSKDFILYIAEDIQQLHAHDPVKKSMAIRDLVESISKIADQLKRQIYIKECAEILRLDEGVLIKETNRTIRKDIAKQKNAPLADVYGGKEPRKSRLQEVNEKKSVRLDASDQERDIVRILLRAGDKYYDEENGISLGEYILVNLSEVLDVFESKPSIEIINEYRNQLASGGHPSNEFFLNHQDDEVRALSTDLLSEPFTYADWSSRGVELQTQKPFEENYVKDSYQVLLRIKLKKVNDLITGFQDNIRQEGDYHDEVIIGAYKKLLEQRKNIADELNQIVI